MKRVVITGTGIVSCIGNDDAAVTESLRSGRSGIRAMPEFAEMGLRSQVAGVPQIDLEALHAKRLHLFGVSNKLRPAAERAQTVRAFEKDLLPYFADGRIVPVVDRVFAFEDLAVDRRRPRRVLEADRPRLGEQHLDLVARIES